MWAYNAAKNWSVYNAFLEQFCNWYVIPRMYKLCLDCYQQKNALLIGTFLWCILLNCKLCKYIGIFWYITWIGILRHVYIMESEYLVNAPVCVCALHIWVQTSKPRGLHVRVRQPLFSLQSTIMDSHSNFVLWMNNGHKCRNEHGHVN